MGAASSSTTAGASAGTGNDTPSVRPQTLMLNFLGVYIVGQDVAVFSGSIIEVLDRLGVSEDAARTTLARMVKRGLLEPHRRGRRKYFGLTPRSIAVLRDGQGRVWSTTINPEWDGSWTVVGYSLPDSWRNERRDLRSRLTWAGFGPLQNGMWVAPGVIDVRGVTAGLGLDEHLNVFVARTAEPTDTVGVLRSAFDPATIAARHHRFLERWDRANPLPDAPDELSRRLMLHSDWLQLVRYEPRLPAAYKDWPASRSESIFHMLDRAYEEPAKLIAASLLDTIDLVG